MQDNVGTDPGQEAGSGILVRQVQRMVLEPFVMTLEDGAEPGQAHPRRTRPGAALHAHDTVNLGGAGQELQGPPAQVPHPR